MLKYFLWCLLSTVSLVCALPKVKLGQTALSGRAVSDSVEFFGGIPYAEPPLGDLRLRPPVIKTRLDFRSFNASSHGKACPQPFVEDLTTISEDCLTISIWRPANISAKAKLPILFWTYGGAYAVGSSSKEDGTNLVERSIARGTPIIYVSFNHRLGPLGVPQGQEADDRRALNLGVQDQTAALRWIQANIHFFGGDPSKVTAFGQSSGSIMLAIQYLDPQFDRLVRGVIFESGQLNGLASYTAAEQESGWQNFVNDVTSCVGTGTSGNSLPCLRNATTEEITEAILQTWNNHWAPVVDKGRGSVFPDFASRLYEKGKFARIPFIAGTNLDEGTQFAVREGLTEEALKALTIEQNGPAPPGLEQLFERAIDRIMQLYPDDPKIGSPYGTGDELFGLPSSYKRQASQVGDMTFDAPRRQWSQAAAHFGVKSYAYLFTHRDPQGAPELGVPHGAEIPYVHGRADATNDEEQKFSTVMMDYWISFTVSLDPNDGKGVKRPVWPRYTKTNEVLLQLEGGNTTVVKDDYRKEQNEFLIQNALVLRR
ncbi:hypothetical protein NMY22_g10863 [Coprinellus aureogranulatus]|nr:hypothetical protein NMY22_g10863 [Coprinellus aureogranulatus]